MKTIFIAIWLSLLSATCAAQNVEAEARQNGGRVNDETLISCVKSGDVSCVAWALAMGADANVSDEEGRTILTLAAEGKDARIIRLLLDSRARVDKAQEGEGSPLCRAALFGRKENVEVLLERGAKVKIVCDGDHGDTPLMVALRGAMFNDMPSDLKDSLVGTDDDGDASGENDGDGKKDESSKETKMLREALSAPREDFLAIARLLLARGADVNVIANCDEGETALMYAAFSSNVEMVKELLSSGADVNEGASALTLLVQTDLERAKAERLAVPARSKEQDALLEWIRKTTVAREEIKRLLRAAGAKEPEDELDDDEPDAKALEEAANEALRDAIEQNDIKDFTRLVEAYSAHPLGELVLPEALRKAVIFTRTEMVKLLLERGVDPNREKPLIQAAHSGNLEYVRMLLDAGADMNVLDKEGRTALDVAEDWASSEEHRAVVKLLKARGAKSKRQKR